ncbi:MAG: hypothetical protein SGCHY_005258 [Lobulomycetales sp.]
MWFLLLLLQLISLSQAESCESECSTAIKASEECLMIHVLKRRNRTEELLDCLCAEEIQIRNHPSIYAPASAHFESCRKCHKPKEDVSRVDMALRDTEKLCSGDKELIESLDSQLEAYELIHKGRKALGNTTFRILYYDRVLIPGMWEHRSSSRSVSTLHLGVLLVALCLAFI